MGLGLSHASPGAGDLGRDCRKSEVPGSPLRDHPGLRGAVWGSPSCSVCGWACPATVLAPSLRVAQTCGTYPFVTQVPAWHSGARAWPVPPTGMLSRLPDPPLPPRCEESPVFFYGIGCLPTRPPQLSDDTPVQSREPMSRGPCMEVGSASRRAESQRRPLQGAGARPCPPARPCPGPRLTGSRRVASTRCT